MRPIERAIKRRINAELSFGARVRKWWRSWNQTVRFSGGAVSLVGIFTAISVRLVVARQGADPLLLFLALFAGLLLMPDRLTTNLRKSQTVLMLAYYPVEDQALFRKVWRSWLMFSFLFLFLHAALFMGAAVMVPPPLPWALVVVAAIGNWLTFVSLEALLAAYPITPRMKGLLSALLLILSGALFFGVNRLPPGLTEQTPWILLCLPTGWFAGAFRSAIVGGPIPLAAYLLGPAVAICGLPLAYRRLARGYQIREYAFWDAQPYSAVLESDPPSYIAEVESDAAFDEADDAPDWQVIARERLGHEGANGDGVGRHEIGSDGLAVELVRQQLHHGHLRNATGLIERAVLRCLSPREQQIAEVLLTGWWAGTIQWTKRWITSGRYLGIAIGLISVAPLPVPWRWTAFLAVIVCAMFGAPITGGSWPGFSFDATSMSARHCVLPMSFAEISRVVILVNGIRLLAWLPLAILGCIAAAWKVDWGVMDGIRLAVLGTYVLIVGQTIPVVVRFDSGSRHRLFTIRGLVSFFVLLVAVTMMGGSLVLMFHPDLVWSLAGGLGFAVGSWLGWATYKRWYERGRVDVCTHRGHRDFRLSSG